MSRHTSQRIAAAETTRSLLEQEQAATSERIPYLIVGERAELYGLTYLEQAELERREPWLRNWSARFGNADREGLTPSVRRVRAWIAAGRPAANRTLLSVSGSTTIVRAVRDVVKKLPEVVAHFLVGNVEIICIGAGEVGWCADAPLPPCDAPLRVALATVDHGIIAHELAHAWHRSPLPAQCRLSAVQLEALGEGIRALAVSSNRSTEYIDHSQLIERAADALACCWGFVVDTTSGWRGDHRRRVAIDELERSAAALAPQHTLSNKEIT